jgi:hypothetical protein
VLHEAIVQALLVHAAVACGRVHTVPQALQLAGSPAVLISQPLNARWSQSAYPGLHVPMRQIEPVHEGVACAGAHTRPQAPQLFGSLVVLTSQPSDAKPSQST